MLNRTIVCQGTYSSYPMICKGNITSTKAAAAWKRYMDELVNSGEYEVKRTSDESAQVTHKLTGMTMEYWLGYDNI